MKKLMVIISLSVAAVSSQAAVNYWTGAVDADYGNTTNWSLGTIPSSADYSLMNGINVGEGAPFPIIDYAAPAVNILGVGWDAGVIGGELTVVDGGSINTLTALQIGRNSLGTLNMTGGNIIAGGALQLGEGTGTGTVYLSGDLSNPVTTLHAAAFTFTAGTIHMTGNSRFMINGDKTLDDYVGAGVVVADGAGESILETYNAGAGRTEYTVIPEPATLGMVALVGGGILFIRRKFVI